MCCKNATVFNYNSKTFNLMGGISSRTYINSPFLSAWASFIIGSTYSSAKSFVSRKDCLKIANSEHCALKVVDNCLERCEIKKHLCPHCRPRVASCSITVSYLPIVSPPSSTKTAHCLDPQTAARKSSLSEVIKSAPHSGSIKGSRTIVL